MHAEKNMCIGIGRYRRSELSASQRATSIARRKAIYLELHPETRHGGDRKSDQVDNLATRSFAAETATATGRDERTIRRDAERGEKVIPEVMEMIAGTRLDTGTVTLRRDFPIRLQALQLGRLQL